VNGAVTTLPVLLLLFSKNGRKRSGKPFAMVCHFLR